MIVGVLQLNLFIPQADSLKSKRRILKSLKDKIRQRFNISIAEVNSSNKWQSAMYGVSCVNSDRRMVNSILSKVVNLVDRQHTVELVDYSIELI